MVQRGHSASLKGKTYERRIAKYLTTNTGVTFNRTAYSGAQSSDSNQERTFIGDLFPELDSVYAGLNYELKNHDNITLNNLVMNNGEFPKFLEQVITDTNRTHTTVPCLIIHLNHLGDVVLLPYNRDLYFKIYDKKPKLLFTKIYSFNDDRKGIQYDYDLMAFLIQDFVSISQEDLKEYLNIAKITYDSLNLDKVSQISEDSNKVDEIVDNLENQLTNNKKKKNKSK